jgi:hypothetical protein
VVVRVAGSGPFLPKPESLAFRLFLYNWKITPAMWGGKILKT